MPMTATKLADLQKAALVHTQKAREIIEANADKDPHDWSEDDRKTYDEALAKGREKLDEIKTAKADLAIIDGAKVLADEIGNPEVKADLDAQGNHPIRERVKSLGLQVVESPEFKAMLKPFTTADGSVRIGEKTRIQSDPISIKGLFVGGTDTSAGAFVVNEQTGIVEMLGRKELKIRDLISVRRTGSDTVEYVEQTSHTNAAAVVAEATSSAAPQAPAGTTQADLVRDPNGGYKPEGSWAFVRRSAVVKTIAEWVPATKRALADVAQLEGLIDDELRADVAEAEEGQILAGDGTGENFTGIRNWSGIQTQTFSTDIFETIRKAITKVRYVGRANPTGVVISPATAEIIDLAKDLNGAYRYGGPQAIGVRTVWGVPTVVSETQADTDVIVGDFSKAVFWDREQTTVTMSDSHADFFVRNMVAILGEERGAFAVTRPKAFVKAALS
jgi:HK97 family phage major capsid protein